MLHLTTRKCCCCCGPQFRPTPPGQPIEPQPPLPPPPTFDPQAPVYVLYPRIRNIFTGGDAIYSSYDQAKAAIAAREDFYRPLGALADFHYIMYNIEQTYIIEQR